MSLRRGGLRTFFTGAFIASTSKITSNQLVFKIRACHTYHLHIYFLLLMGLEHFIDSFILIPFIINMLENLLHHHFLLNLVTPLFIKYNSILLINENKFIRL